jgi:cytochrome c oxidase subunit 2
VGSLFPTLTADANRLPAQVKTQLEKKLHPTPRMKDAWIAFLLLGLAAGGCTGIQSSLEPAGRDAAWLAALWWWMAAGAALVWGAVMALGLYYGRPHEAAPNPTRDRWLIVGAGVVFPVSVLTALLVYGVSGIPRLVARAPEGSLSVDVTGELWWWRVSYTLADGERLELANEIRLPVDEPVQFRLTSDNVIHSFWIPSLGGKMDMIPGRTTHLALHPTRTGTFAGACAEYCGTAHAFMRLLVRVTSRAEFDAWLAAQAAPAAAPSTDAAGRGRQVLLGSGCGACHTVRGTAAAGVIGPDLTHVGSRLSLAAGSLPADRAAFERWIAAPERLKPGVHMPSFGMLAEGDRRDLAEYLGGLR